jgi:hypothetical protein
MPEQSRDRLPVHPARLRHMPVSVERLGDPQPHEIVEQCIARSGVASDQIVAVNVGDVGDAADIEDRDRRLEPEPPRQRAMIHRRERRAFSAGVDVGGAEVIDNWNAEPGCEHAAVADLNRQPALGPMQHGLAVEPDHGDVARPNTIGGQERCHRFDMRVIYSRLGGGDDLRSGPALGDIQRHRRGAPDQRSLRRGVRTIGGAAETGNDVAIGFDQGDIHAVLRGSAHQPHREYRRRQRRSLRWLRQCLRSTHALSSLVEPAALELYTPARAARVSLQGDGNEVALSAAIAERSLS